MKFSLRTKIVATYGILSALFILILVSGHSQLREIALRLDLIQLGYLPITKTVNSFGNFNHSFGNFNHLNESFDVAKIVANRENRLFIDSISITNPRLMEQGLRKGLADARAALRNSSSPQQEQALDRVGILVNRFLEAHRAYVRILIAALEDVRSDRVPQALGRNDTLLEQKRKVHTQLDLLSRKLDELIRDGIRDTVKEEQFAVRLVLFLSVLTIGLAILIGWMAIRALRPLARLKQAAREIAAGELEKRVQIQTADEVGDLATEFNRMADSIQQRDAAIRQSQEKLLQSEKMAVVGRMAAKISHEVKNPLNSLGLNIELLEEEIQSEEGRKTLKAMSTEIDRLNQVAEGYLSLARGRRPLAELTDLNKVLSHLETLVRAECEEKGIAIEIEAPPELPLLHVDVTRLEQALLNLARNAIEALRSGGKLGVRIARENGGIRLEIWDNGPGIPPEILPHIFEPFYTTKDKGTGLGLAITSEIVRAQGGTIECRSTIGEGSSFLVRLPIKSHDV
ncbi:MAG: ATP-binding protein [Pseudomonadota bacterium]